LFANSGGVRLLIRVSALRKSRTGMDSACPCEPPAPKGYLAPFLLFLPPPARTRRPPPESGGEPVRSPCGPVARSIRRFSSVPQCLRCKGWFGGLGRSPLQGSGLMGVLLTQAFSLGFVRSPLRGSKTTSDFARLGFVRLPLWGARTMADFARLSFPIRQAQADPNILGIAETTGSARNV